MDTWDRTTKHSAYSGASSLDAIPVDDDNASDFSEETSDFVLAAPIAHNDHHEDIQKLLVFTEIYYSPELKEEKPRQMAHSLVLMEHQKICLT